MHDHRQGETNVSFFYVSCVLYVLADRTQNSQQHKSTDRHWDPLLTDRVAFLHCTAVFRTFALIELARSITGGWQTARLQY